MHNPERVQRLNTEADLSEYLENDLFLEHLVALAHVLDPPC